MFFDPDNHGFLDLISANGHVYPEVDTAHLGSAYKEPRLFYRNTGAKHFADLSGSSGPGLTLPASSRGLATADLWNEGRISVVVNNISGQPMLLVNRQPNSHHWVTVEAEGTRSNRDGIGARITVRTKRKSDTQEVRSGGSYISSSDLRVHFGLGDTARADTTFTLSDGTSAHLVQHGSAVTLEGVSRTVRDYQVMVRTRQAPSAVRLNGVPFRPLTPGPGGRAASQWWWDPSAAEVHLRFRAARFRAEIDGIVTEAYTE